MQRKSMDRVCSKNGRCCESAHTDTHFFDKQWCTSCTHTCPVHAACRGIPATYGFPAWVRPAPSQPLCTCKSGRSAALRMQPSLAIDSGATPAPASSGKIAPCRSAAPSSRTPCTQGAVWPRTSPQSRPLKAENAWIRRAPFLDSKTFQGSRIATAICLKGADHEIRKFGGPRRLAWHGGLCAHGPHAGGT